MLNVELLNASPYEPLGVNFSTDYDEKFKKNPEAEPKDGENKIPAGKFKRFKEKVRRMGAAFIGVVMVRQLRLSSPTVTTEAASDAKTPEPNQKN